MAAPPPQGLDAVFMRAATDAERQIVESALACIGEQEMEKSSPKRMFTDKEPSSWSVLKYTGSRNVFDIADVRRFLKEWHDSFDLEVGADVPSAYHAILFGCGEDDGSADDVSAIVTIGPAFYGEKVYPLTMAYHPSGFGAPSLDCEWTASPYAIDWTSVRAVDFFKGENTSRMSIFLFALMAIVECIRYRVVEDHLQALHAIFGDDELATMTDVIAMFPHGIKGALHVNALTAAQLGEKLVTSWHDTLRNNAKAARAKSDAAIRAVQTVRDAAVEATNAVVSATNGTDLNVLARDVARSIERAVTEASVTATQALVNDADSAEAAAALASEAVERAKDYVSQMLEKRR